jgi:legumain
LLVIVAGSNGFDNYRHQADACHAYHVAVKSGTNPENIIMMFYDDIANDPSNPFPGQVFNKPTDAGTPGVDVYAGCQKDYTGDKVTPQNFVAVLVSQNNSKYELNICRTI